MKGSWEAWLYSPRDRIMKSVFPTGPKARRPRTEALKTWAKANLFSSGWLSQVFYHNNRKWTCTVLQSNVAMWVSSSQGVLIFIINLTAFSIFRRYIPSVCLWECFQKELTKEKDPPWSRWDTIPLPGDSQWLKGGKEKANNLFPGCRDKITKCLTFHPHNHTFPAITDCIL